MATKQSLPDQYRDHNDALGHGCERVLGMDLKTVKTVKNGLLSFLFLGFAVVLVLQGADPTLTFSGTLVLLALLNGIEMGELYAAWGEVRRIQEQASQDATEDD